MHGWIVRITTPVRNDDPLVWEFKMPTLDRQKAMQWGRSYGHTLPSAIVEAIERY
jgi:hypothetical protein